MPILEMKWLNQKSPRIHTQLKNIILGLLLGIVCSCWLPAANWIPINSGLTNLYIRTLAVDSSGTVYAGTHGAGVFRLDNGGTSWTAVKQGLQILYVNSLAIG